MNLDQIAQMNRILLVTALVLSSSFILNPAMAHKVGQPVGDDEVSNGSYAAASKLPPLGPFAAMYAGAAGATNDK